MSELDRRVIPSLLVRDMGETLEWYAGVLGFSVTGRWPSDVEPPTWAEVTRDGAVVQLYTDPPMGTPDAPVMSGTLYFHPTDVAALAEEISARTDLAWGPEVMEYGMLEFAVQDPNGYYLAFWEPAAE